MNKRNVFLLTLLLLLLLCIGAFQWGAQLSTHTQIATASAADLPDVFRSVRNILLTATAPQQFEATPDTADGLVLTDISIELRNNGLFDAEWISATLTPRSGDIAVYSLSGEGTTIPARSSSTFNMKLIGRSSDIEGRSILLEYYVLGMEKQITIIF